MLSICLCVSYLRRRNCERSEAIYKTPCLDCFVVKLRAMTTTQEFLSEELYL